MNIIKLKTKTGNQKYPIIIGNNILIQLQSLLNKNLINFNQVLIIVDKNVPRKLINKVLTSLEKKKYSFIILMLMKKIKITKVLIKFYLFF